MEQAPVASLKKTPLNARHRSSGARMVPFSGWDMPVEYSGITGEHMAVRERAGLFDVSHMGEIEIAGKDALAAVQRISCNDAAKLQVGQAHYSGLLTPQGTFVDDLLVYRLASAHFLLVVNAGNIAQDYAWIAEHITPAGDAVAVDASSRYALIAVQGPAALEILQPLTGVDLGALKYYWFAHGEVAGVLATLSRTGYTGEDGFEMFVPPQSADRVWLAILESGKAAGVTPCGLGARDTLRLEAGMRLHGSDIDETTTALEADLAWIVGWNKEDFVGASALREQKSHGVRRKIVGFEMLDKGIARHSYDTYASGVKAGHVTSGTQTPYLKKAIGMAYLPVESAGLDTEFEIDIRGRRARARVVPLPFYKRPK
ncbi:MAG: glycine cleavage system protein T [Acidobacteria bacterium RIFCSPLOWO2_12_FULL_65_11]|nr:MAG: glycine cleavage system protein T [Acidobacteria bacterium RIFCSPLOWO2_02_FULL_64_15]OFW28699.1 MAG: glycine cleavage system protein T [Acidobacteria bacterium RIFCSPLOWO2_12_FULL_65_11]